MWAKLKSFWWVVALALAVIFFWGPFWRFVADVAKRALEFHS